MRTLHFWLLCPGACGTMSLAAAATLSILRRAHAAQGLGFVDAVADKQWRALAAAQRETDPATTGRTNTVLNVSTGRFAVGKFGWKAQVPSLLQFAADALVNEIGITNPLFRNEVCRQGDCGALSGEAAAGEQVFTQIGCASCHLPTIRTGPSAIGALDRVDFHPYSDFLLHDMGALTQPLWGLRNANRFLHDAASRTIEDAVRRRDGQALARRSYGWTPPLDWDRVTFFGQVRSRLCHGRLAARG